MVAQLSGAEPVRSTIVGHASLRRDPERSHCAEDQGYSRAPAGSRSAAMAAPSARSGLSRNDSEVSREAPS